MVDQKKEPTTESVTVKANTDDSGMNVEGRASPSMKPVVNDRQWTTDERFFYRWYLKTQVGLVFITVAGILVAICSLRSLNESVTAANRQAAVSTTLARITQRQFEATRRAWMGIDSIEIKPYDQTTKVPPEDAGFNTYVAVKNFGNSLATDIRLSFDLAETGDLAQKAKAVCAKSVTSQNRREISLFPSKTTPYVFGTYIPQVRALTTKTDVFLLGCFAYGDPFTKCDDWQSCYYTRFAYRIRFDEKAPAHVSLDLWNDYNSAH